MKKTTFLELGSNGYYYMIVPSRLESKGLFPFDLNSAVIELQRTINFLRSSLLNN